MNRLECVPECPYCAGLTSDVDPADGPTTLTATKDATGMPDLPRYNVEEGVRRTIRGGAPWPPR